MTNTLRSLPCRAPDGTGAFFLALLSVGAFLTVNLMTAKASDWPQWRGPDRNGIATGQPRLARVWPSGGPPLLWKTEAISAGNEYGYGTPVVADGRVYLFATTRGRDMIYCFSETTGATLWRKDYPVTTGHGYASSSSVCVDNGRLYVGGTDSKAYCLDATNGNPIWTVDLSNRWLRQQELHGSFLVVDGVAVIQGGQHDGTDAPYGGVAALDAATGAMLWFQPKFGSEGSPVAWRKDGRTYILTVANDGVSCMDLVTGHVMWNVTPGGACHTLAVSGDYAVFNSDGYPNRGLVCFGLATNKAGVVWQLQDRTYDAGSAVVIHDGHVYVANSNQGENGGGSQGTVLCAELATGTVAWEKPFTNLSYFCPVIADGKFFVSEGYGSRLVMVDATPAQYTVLGRADVAPYSYVSTVIAGGKLFSRRSNGIYCYDLTEKANHAPTIAAAATCAPNPVPLPHTAALSVAANDQDNDPLTYTWSKASGPGAVGFSPNGTNASASSTAVFGAAGAYGLRVVVADGRGGSVTSEVAVTVQTPGIATSAANVTVPEGGTATFDVKLAAMPAGNVTVTVARAGGDTNVTVSGGANLVFTTGNWGTWQTVTLSASHDSDAAGGVATIVCSAGGLNSAMTIATEAEDDAILSVGSNPIRYSVPGTTTPTGATVVARGVDTPIAAAAKTGYVFVKWIVTGGTAVIADAYATSTTAKVTSDAAIQAYFGATGALSLSADSPSTVPEGGWASFRFRLSAPPTGAVTVTAARTEGDADVSVAGGATLVFTPDNWNVCQNVNLAAAQDADATNGAATITISGPGVTTVTRTVKEADDDTLLTVEAMTGGAVTPAGTMLVTKGSTLGIAAIPDTGYTFVNWRVIAGEATIANAGATNTTVTVRDTATVCANFSSRPGNRAPTIVTPAYASPNPITAPWPTTVRVAAADPDGDPLTYTWAKVSGMGAVSFSPNGTAASATSAATFDQGGNYLLRVTVSDGDGGAVSSDMTVTVNAKPFFLTSGGYSVPEGGTATLQVRLYGSQPGGNVTTTVARTAGDVDVTVQSGATLIFTPSNYETYQNVILAAAKDADATNGTATITISAPGLDSTIRYATEADSDMQAPAISSVAVLYGTVGAPYRYDVAATGNPPPIVAVSGMPGWLTLSGNTISGTPSSPGTYGPITVTAGNGINPVATQKYSIVVTGMDPNEWAQWRGPNRDGAVTTVLEIAGWPPPAVWSNTLEKGESGMALSEGRLYTMGRKQYGPGVFSNLVYCLDADTGTGLWVRAYPASVTAFGYGPQATPTVAGNEVYTFDDTGRLYCFDKITGAVLWNQSVDMGRPAFGYSGSPLVEGDRIVLNACGAGAAVSRTTHEVVWSAASSLKATYASPVMLSNGDGRIVLTHSEGALNAVNPLDGSILWSNNYDSASMSGYAAADPVVFDGDKILLYENGLAILQAATNSVTELVPFNPDAMGASYSTPVVVGGCAYAVNNIGELARIDLANGTMDWNLPVSPAACGNLIAAGDRLMVFADGELRVVKIGPAGFDEEGRLPIVVTTTDLSNYGWTPPSIYRERIYCRVGQVLVCYQVGTTSGVDRNGNGVDDGWEWVYCGGTNRSLAWLQATDSDGDGMSDWAEYVAGTSPNDSGSCLAVSNLATGGTSGFVVRWTSEPRRYYDLWRSTNLVNGFDVRVGQDLPATPPLNVHTDNTANCGTLFYRIEVK